MKYRYRLTQRQKDSIGSNLIDFMESREALSKESARFIGDWILTGAGEKSKAFYDVWDIVLRSYMPQTRPILFRSCCRFIKDKIVSFTGRLSSAERFSRGKGLLIICDTSDLLFPLEFAETHPQVRPYRNTFFPVAELLRKEARSPNCKFPERLVSDYSGEDEYIMRVNLDLMCRCKFAKINKGFD